MPSRKAVVATVVAVVAFLGLGFFAVERLTACGSRDDAEALSKILEHDYAPPLSHVDLEGWCDDESPFFGVTSRLGADRDEARRTLARLGCKDTGRPPKSLDFDEVAAWRMSCDFPDVGAVLVSVEPRGSMLSKQEFEGVRGLFAPLGG